jgi:hypothetical protein
MEPEGTELQPKTDEEKQAAARETEEKLSEIDARKK